MNFAEAARNESHFTLTENGAVALNTTGCKALDLFGTIGALRNQPDIRIQRLFADAYNEDPLTATKIAFYARDVREGLGERNTFRIMLKYMAEFHPEALINNIKLIGEYGRYDDLYCLIGTPLEDNMWAVMKEQFEADKAKLNSDKPISLLAKWIKTADSSVKATRELGIKTAIALGYSVYDFKRIVRQMRKKIRVTEGLMSTNQWDTIDYSTVPSRASMIYRKAFRKHDESRYARFIAKAVIGQAKINSSTLYPYDLIEKVWGYYRITSDDTVEAQWRQLPNYVKEGSNAIVIADTSGSMSGRPMNTAVGLAIYFAERNKGPFHNLWMSFSHDSRMNELKGETLAQKLASIDTNHWDGSTNLYGAFINILNIAIKNHVPADEMVKTLIVTSDMEIDRCSDKDWTFYDEISDKYRQAGYEIPNIIFWNVASRNDVFHADSKRKGVQLASGQSTTVFKQIMDCVGMTPVEAMMRTLNSERYDCITIAK